MRIPIAEDTRQEVIAKWLSGWPRDKIAGELGIGAGTVTNIITKWTNEVGSPTASAVRQLSIEIRRSGMSIHDCARGFRFMRILSSRMSDDEISQFEIFLTKVYNKSKYLNLSPEHLVEMASEIWELSKTMPTSEIASYLKEKIKENESLEAKIKELNAKIELAYMDYNRSLYISKTSAQELQEFVAARQFFSKHGLGMNDLQRLTVALQTAEIYGSDINQIVEKISSNKSLAAEEQDLQRRLAQERKDLQTNQRDSEIMLMDYDQRAEEIKYGNDLKSMGFGMNEFIALKRILLEFAEAKNSDGLVANPPDVVKLFFRRVEELRNVEAKIVSLKEEVNRIEELYKSSMDGMKEFMGHTKKEVKELSDMAIDFIKMAYQENKSDYVQDTKSKSIA